MRSEQISCSKVEIVLSVLVIRAIRYMTVVKVRGLTVIMSHLFDSAMAVFEGLKVLYIVAEIMFIQIFTYVIHSYSDWSKTTLLITLEIYKPIQELYDLICEFHALLFLCHIQLGV